MTAKIRVGLRPSGLVLILLVTLLQGCAMSSVFNPYPSQAAEFRSAIGGPEEREVLSDLKAKASGADKVLYLMEQGRIAQLAGDYGQSREAFRLAIEAMDAERDRARISLTGIGAGAASAVTNDNAIPYAARPYEQVMVHHYQALNYLALGEVEGAAVEARRANLLQVELLELHNKELARAEQAAREKGYDIRGSGRWPEYSAMDETVGKVKSAFQNAYTFYLSGLIYEANGAANDAYIDYRKALEINPDNRFLQEDVRRLGQKLGMSDLPPVSLAAADLDPGKGRLVVLYEDGLIQPKEEVRLPLFTPAGLFQVAMPIYVQRWRNPQALAVAGGSQPLLLTQPLALLDAMAARNLQDEMPAIILRQTVRLVTKYEMQRSVNRNDDPLISIGTQLFNIISESADRRSWLTLPADVQMARFALQPGEQSIQLGQAELGRRVPVKIQAGRTTVLQVVNTGPRMIVHTFQL